MIDNFAPQPYPLEASAEPGTWVLVIGWRQTPDGQLTPVLAPPDGALTTAAGPSGLRYRPADTRPIGGPQSGRIAAPTVLPARSGRPA